MFQELWKKKREFGFDDWVDINQTCVWELFFEKEKMQSWLVEAFCWCFLNSEETEVHFTFFSSGYCRQVSKQKAAITFWEELEVSF